MSSFLFFFLWECQINIKTALDSSLSISYKNKHTLIIWFSDIFFWFIHAKTWTLVHIAAFFTVEKTWKQSRCLLIGEWINRLGGIQEISSYLGTKINEGLAIWLCGRELLWHVQYSGFNPQCLLFPHPQVILGRYKSVLL